MSTSEVILEEFEIEDSSDVYDNLPVDYSEETSEETSSESTQIDYTETLTVLNDNVELVSHRLDFISVSFWILLSIIIAVLFYRIFAWFWKDL